MTVTVVTDSAASLPADAAERFGIVVVPMTLVLGGVVYPDDEVPLEELIGHLGTEHVSTASPSVGAFLKAMESASEEGEVLVLTVSSNMSSTFDAARTAAGYLAPGSVQVIDTKTAAGAQGLVALAAARQAERGAALEEVAAVAERVASRVRLLGSLDNLEYLARGGRVPVAAARAGRTLGVRALFEFSDGRATARRPALSASATVDRLVGECLAGGRDGARLHAAVLHARCPDLAEGLCERVVAGAPDAVTFLAPFSPVMVAHTGPGLLGVAWWWDDDGDRAMHLLMTAPGDH